MPEDVENVEKVFTLFFDNETDQMFNFNQTPNMTAEVSVVELRSSLGKPSPLCNFSDIISKLS